MKRTALFVAFFCLLSLTILEAQTPDRQHAFVGKRLFNDYHTPITGEFSEFDNYRGGFEVAYFRNLSQYANFGIPFQLGVINLPEEDNNRTILGLDAVLQIQYYKPEFRIIPYAIVGVGGVMEEFDELNFQIPAGFGVNFRLGKYAFINVQSTFRKSLSADRDNFQHGIGLGFLIGKIEEESPALIYSVDDRDRDGVDDKEDLCPDVPGTSTFSGCPDSDADGVQDSEDACPNVAGAITTKGCPDTDGDGISDDNDDCPDAIGSLNGCPDSDGDGVANKDDDCPDRAGSKASNGCPNADGDNDGFADDQDECPTVSGSLRGCPDTDGDGIADKNDACPNAKGEGRFNGCPDTDGDGIEDSKDKCPNAAAPESPTGCPEIKVEDRAVLDYALQAVQFEFASSVLLTNSYPVLDQVYGVLQKYPEHYLSITGHTDNVGDPTRNRNLSIERARSCYDYLVNKGIPSNRINIGGYGMDRPIADNDTEEGRTLNRRVEFQILPL